MSTKVYMGEGGSKSPKTGLRSLWMAPLAVVFQPHPSKKKVVVASVGEFRIVPVKKWPHSFWQWFFSLASVGEFHIVPSKWVQIIVIILSN